MEIYKCLKHHPVSAGGIELTTIKAHEIERVRIWRNNQRDVLRQNSEISADQQVEYFRNFIWNDLESLKPMQVLMSIYKEGIHIGYGGLVHISWENSRAEISFLLDPSIPENSKIYFEIFRDYLDGIESVAISSLKLHKLILETYNFRENHIKAIESAGYLQEGVLTDHVFINSKWHDSILHGKIIE